MGFNYAAEKKRFDQTWSCLWEEYTKAGMSPAAIQLLYEFDLELFRSQRVYVNHTQALPSESISDITEENSSLFRKFSDKLASFDEMSFSGRHSWIETIENQRLAVRLKQLSDDDLELLTFLVLEGHSQRELARKWGCTQAAISQRYKRIIDFLK